MNFWIIALCITALCVAPILLAMRRPRASGDLDQSKSMIEIKVYKDQLAEVDRDLARGVLSQNDAARTRVEVSRRILEADQGQAKTQGNGEKSPTWLIALLGIATVLGGVALYKNLGAAGYPDMPLAQRLAQSEEARRTRLSQSEMEAQFPALTVDENADPGHVELIEKLSIVLKTRPNDIEGHKLLARNAASLGRYKQSYVALQRVIELQDESTANDYVLLAGMMISAVGGYVSPQAETALSRSLKLDPKNGLANYHVGTMFLQLGRPDQTFNIWEPLLSRSNPQDPWVTIIRNQLPSVAQAAGVNYTLPALTDLSGPTHEDVAAAADLSPQERQEMITSMIDQLSERLNIQGGTVEEWARLITSFAATSQDERAAQTLQTARATFTGQSDALKILQQAAQQAGLE